MSRIKNGGLDQYGAEPFEQQQFGTAGVKGVNTYLPKNKTSRDLDHAHLGAVCHHRTTQSRWENPHTPRSVISGPHICIWGPPNSLAPALSAYDWNYDHFYIINQNLVAVATSLENLSKIFEISNQKTPL